MNQAQIIQLFDMATSRHLKYEIANIEKMQSSKLRTPSFLES